MKRIQTIVLIVWVVCFTVSLAYGASKTLTVSTTVNNSCALSSGDSTLSFGTYDGVGSNAATPLTQTTNLQLQCTNGTTARILLDQGQNPGPASTDAAPVRYMTNGSNKLAYQLYTNSTRANIWNNVVGVGQSVSGTGQPLSIYGSILPGQVVPPGTYTDTVTISINY